MNPPRPFGLLAELTYRCLLHCPYCANPTKYPTGLPELTTAEWHRVFHEAAELGVLHALFSGGEPLLRHDLCELVASAHAAGLYTNLITSGVGLSAQKAEVLKNAGLDSVQISFQADIPELSKQIAGAEAFESKLAAAQAVQKIGLPLTLNVVVHRLNIHRVTQIIAFAEKLGAKRLELAHTQYVGWAYLNRTFLLPTKKQMEKAMREIAHARQQLQNRMEILHVLSDYFADRPKPCMNGWGQRYLTVNPVGEVLPCPTAREIPHLHFENIRHKPLRWIWTASEAFNRFRGTLWMQEPCRSCPHKMQDFGGCRCQAMLLTGDPTATDPACALSPHHTLIKQLQAGTSQPSPLTPTKLEDIQHDVVKYRSNPPH